MHKEIEEYYKKLGGVFPGEAFDQRISLVPSSGRHQGYANFLGLERPMNVNVNLPQQLIELCNNYASSDAEPIIERRMNLAVKGKFKFSIHNNALSVRVDGTCTTVADITISMVQASNSTINDPFFKAASSDDILVKVDNRVITRFVVPKKGKIVLNRHEFENPEQLVEKASPVWFNLNHFSPDQTHIQNAARHRLGMLLKAIAEKRGEQYDPELLEYSMNPTRQAYKPASQWDDEDDDA